MPPNPSTAPKFERPVGRMPVLQFLMPYELEIDPSYQRSLAGGGSRSLIRRIARRWNWGLCLPLVVSRRVWDGDRLFVIDGQHRLAAARQRGDLAQLPCVVLACESVAEEAALFVELNRQRQALGKLDLFKADLASGDPEAHAIAGAISDAGLQLAPHTNNKAWRPATIGNIGGLQASWRGHGPEPTRWALRALAEAWRGEVLGCAGSVFPGIAAICADELAEPDRFACDPERFDLLVEMIGGATQDEWRRDIARVRVAEPDLNFARASEKAFREAWSELLAEALEEVA